MTIGVYVLSWWLDWLLAGLAVMGLGTVLWKLFGWLWTAVDWLQRDRVAELLDDEARFAADEEMAYFDGPELDPLPPERSWEEMTADQPIVVDRLTLWHGADRERRAPWWEAENRAAYESLGFDYPSGLLTRVRELTS